SSDDAPGAIQAPRLVGSFTVEAALKQLLADSGLRYEFVNARTVAIRPVTATESGSKPTADVAGGIVARMAQEGALDNPQAPPSAQGAEEKAESLNRDTLSEIVVTAQKRSERLQDVPVPVTAIAADRLLDQNLVQMRDFYSMVPGLNFSTG